MVEGVVYELEMVDEFVGVCIFYVRKDGEERRCSVVFMCVLCVVERSYW